MLQEDAEEDAAAAGGANTDAMMLRRRNESQVVKPSRGGGARCRAAQISKLACSRAGQGPGRAPALPLPPRKLGGRTVRGQAASAAPLVLARVGYVCMHARVLTWQGAPMRRSTGQTCCGRGGSQAVAVLGETAQCSRCVHARKVHMCPTPVHEPAAADHVHGSCCHAMHARLHGLQGHSCFDVE